MKSQVLRLVLPFMETDDFEKIKDSLDKDMITHYYIERFNLVGNDRLLIMKGLQLYPALSDRLHRHEWLIEKVRNNLFLNTREKVVIQRALKKSDNDMLWRYYSMYDVIVATTATICVDYNTLLAMAPVDINDIYSLCQSGSSLTSGTGRGAARAQSRTRAGPRR